MNRSLAALSLPIGCVLASVVWSCAASPSLAMPGEEHDAAAELYGRNCAACHGDYGGGDGSMAPYLRVWPRDFRRERFHFISSREGVSPATEDLTGFIRTGSRRTHMPGHPWLSESELRLLADFVRDIRRIGIEEEVRATLIEADEEFTDSEVREIAAARVAPGQRLDVPLRATDYRADTARGAALFQELCASCHGEAGEGDGTEELFDDLGRPIRARDLTAGEYRGGAGDRDLYWRLRCGIPGTPMPAFRPDQLPDGDVWQLVDYLRRLARGKRRGN